MKRQKQKSFWKKFWWFIWEDNSVWSWIANIVIAFVLIKFIIYPGLGFLLGTGFPIVAVVSSSMEHQGSFDDWWSREKCCINQGCSEKVPQSRLYTQYGITPEDFESYSFTNGFNKGDIMILRSPDDLEIGEVLVFWADGRAEPIIHRIIQVRGALDDPKYKTKGDNNCGSAAFEQAIPENQRLGKAILRIPFLGWIKIAFVDVLQLAGVLG